MTPPRIMWRERCRSAATLLTCALIAFAVPALAADKTNKVFYPRIADHVSGYYFTITDESSGVDTNTYSMVTNLVHPYRIGSITFRLPASITNTFQINHIRRLRVDQSPDDTITTNHMGRIETNVWHATTNTFFLSWSNTPVFTASSTNIQQVTYDTDDLPKEWYFLGQDTVTLSWSYTNAPIPFILHGTR